MLINQRGCKSFCNPRRANAKSQLMNYIMQCKIAASDSTTANQDFSKLQKRQANHSEKNNKHESTLFLVLVYDQLILLLRYSCNCVFYWNMLYRRNVRACGLIGSAKWFEPFRRPRRRHRHVHSLRFIFDFEPLDGNGFIKWKCNNMPLSSAPHEN